MLGRYHYADPSRRSSIRGVSRALTGRAERTTDRRRSWMTRRRRIRITSESGLETPHSPLEWEEYSTDIRETWKHLMHAYTLTERKISAMRAQGAGSGVKLALTESHFSAPGRNRLRPAVHLGRGGGHCRQLNVHERNGDILAIATLDDFCCVRWMTSAIMLTQPGPRAG